MGLLFKVSMIIVFTIAMLLLVHIRYSVPRDTVIPIPEGYLKLRKMIIVGFSILTLISILAVIFLS